MPRTETDEPSPRGAAFAREFVRQFRQDIPIWESKRDLERPILCDGDGAIGPFRKWARQFHASAPGSSASGAAAAG